MEDSLTILARRYLGRITLVQLCVLEKYVLMEKQKYTAL